MKHSKLSAIGLGIALGFTTAVAPSDAAEVKLKTASFLPARSVYAKYFYRWVDEVNKRCAGEVKISVVGPAAIKSLEQ